MSTQQEQRRPGRVEWSWRHGPIIGPVNAAGGAAAVAMAADLAQVWPGWPAVGGVAAAVAATMRATHAGVSRLGRAYQGTCWAGAGAWTAWAVAGSPWSTDALAILGVGTLVAGLARPGVRRHEATVAHRRATAASAAARMALAQEWQARLERVARISGTRVVGIQAWPRGGYTLDVAMPPGGAGLRAFPGDVLAALAADAWLPHGCTVEVAPGIHQGRVLLRVPTEDAFVGQIPYPEEITPLSVSGPLPVGVMRDWQQAELSLLDDALIAVGTRGTGKSNFLNALIAALARCPDALIWVIDLNGSGLALAWIREWLEQQHSTQRPVIDWVAPTADEAQAMTQAAVDIAVARKAGYQARCAAVNDDKLPVGPDVPEIVVVLDEGAEVLSLRAAEHAILQRVDQLVSIGRAGRVNLAFSALRPNSDVIGSVNLKKQSGTKVMTGPEDPEEVAMLFGRNVVLPEETYPGLALVKTPGQRRPVMAKLWRLQPQRIAAIARTCQNWRPALDELSARAAGTSYTDRWTRYRAWLAQTGTGQTPTPGPVEDSGAPVAGGVTPAGGGIAGLSASADRLAETMRRLREHVAHAQGQPTPEPDLAEAFERIVGAEDWSDVQDAPAPAPPVPVDGPTRMLHLLTKAGADGLHWQQLLDRLVAEGVETSRPTLYRWLGEAQAAGTVTQVRKGYWAASDPQ